MATGAETGTQRSSGAMWTLVVVALATFMLMLDLTVVNVALPDIRAAFGSSFSSLQWILDAYALGLAGVLLAAGSLADRIGRKRVFDVGLVVFVLASLACGLAPNDLVLIIARFVQGLGGAILFAVGPALLGHEFRGKDRGMAFGVFGAVTGLAIAFGPLIGGALTESAGWRWIFLINVPLTIMAIVIGLLKMRESRSETPPPMDWPGMITFSAGLFLLVFGFMRGEADGWTSFTVLGCFGLSVALLVLFTWLQFSRPDAAMFDLSLFGNRTFNGLSVVTALCAITVMPSLFLLIAYVQNMLGYSAFASGVRFLPLTLLLFVAAALAGTVVTKVKPGLLVGASQLLIAAGLAAVLLVDADSSWTALIPAMILIGLGMGVFNPPRAAFSIAVTTPDKSGMASGVNETFQQAGVAIGIAAVGAFFQNRVSGAFVETDTAQRVFDEQAHTAGDAVAAAGPSAVLEGLPGTVAGTVRAAAETAFIDGLHSTMLLVAILAAISGAIAFATMRWADLDEAALDSAGVPADDDSALDTVPVPSSRATGRSGALAAQRAAEIIAQAKADAQDSTGTLTKTAATQRKNGTGRTGTASLSTAQAPTGAKTTGGRGTGRKPGSAGQRDVGTERPTDVLERPTPSASRKTAATGRSTESTARAATSTGPTGTGDPTGSATASGRSIEASRSRVTNRSAESGRFTDSGRSSRSSIATAVDASNSAASLSDRPSSRSDLFAEPTGLPEESRPAVTSDGPAGDADTAEHKPKRIETQGKHRLAEAEPSTARAAGRHRLSSPTATDTPAGPGTRAAGGTGRTVGSDTTVGPSRTSDTGRATPTAPTAAGTTGSTGTGPRAGSRPSTTAGAGTATATARAVITDVIPQPTADAKRKPSTRTNGAAAGPATTTGTDTDTDAAEADVAETVGSSGIAAAAADPVTTESAVPAEQATRRATSRQRSRTAARAAKQPATTEQAEPGDRPARATKQPSKAAKQPAKAAKQPAKATTKQPAKKTATGGTARRTAAKKATANGAASSKPASSGPAASSTPEAGPASEN